MGSLFREKVWKRIVVLISYENYGLHFRGYVSYSLRFLCSVCIRSCNQGDRFSENVYITLVKHISFSLTKLAKWYFSKFYLDLQKDTRNILIRYSCSEQFYCIPMVRVLTRKPWYPLWVFIIEPCSVWSLGTYIYLILYCNRNTMILP